MASSLPTQKSSNVNPFKTSQGFSSANPFLNKDSSGKIVPISPNKSPRGGSGGSSNSSIPTNPISEAIENVAAETKTSSVQLPQVKQVSVGSKFTQSQIQRNKELEKSSQPSIYNKATRITGAVVDKFLPNSDASTFLGISNNFLVGRKYNQFEVNAPEFEQTASYNSATKSGRGTSIITPKFRNKDIYEQLGLDKDDEDGVKYINKLKESRSNYDNGTITWEEYLKNSDEAQTEFEKSAAKKGIGRAAAVTLGTGLALDFLPTGITQFLGIPLTALGGAITADRLLKRKLIAERARRIGTGLAVTEELIPLAAGLVGSGLGKFAQPRLNSVFGKNIISASSADIAESAESLIGNERVKLTKAIVRDIDPRFEADLEAGRITNSQFSKIKVGDREFHVISYQRGSPTAKGTTGNFEVYGYEVVKKPATFLQEFLGTDIGKTAKTKDGIILGRGTFLSREGNTDTYYKLYKFNPQNRGIFNTLKNLVTKEKKANGYQVEVIERGKSGGFRIGTASILKGEKESRVLSSGKITKDVLRQLQTIYKKLESKQQVLPAEIRRVVNIQRRLEGKTPFTEQEFRKAGNPVITKEFIGKLVDETKSKLTVQKLGERGIVTRADVRGFVVGRAKSKPVILKSTFSSKRPKPSRFRNIFKRELNEALSEYKYNTLAKTRASNIVNKVKSAVKLKSTSGLQKASTDTVGARTFGTGISKLVSLERPKNITRFFTGVKKNIVKAFKNNSTKYTPKLQSAPRLASQTSQVLQPKQRRSFGRTESTSSLKVSTNERTGLRLNQAQLQPQTQSFKFKQGQRYKFGQASRQDYKRTTSNPIPYIPKLTTKSSINTGRKAFGSVSKRPFKSKSTKLIKQKIERIAKLRSERPALSPLKSVTGKDFRPQRTSFLKTYLTNRFNKSLERGKYLVKSGKLKSVRVLK